MKKAEIIIGILSIISLGLNLLFIPGSGVMTVLSLSILSGVYFALSFALLNNIRLRNAFKKESYKGIKAGRIIGTIATGIALSITIIGILFKFQSYPGATLEIVYGLFGLLIVVIVGTIRYLKTKARFYLDIYKRILLIGGLGLTLLLLPKGTLIDIKYRNHPSFAKALKNYTSEPFNKEFQSKLEEEKQKMESEN